MLEEEVEEKYYLSDRMIEYIVANNEKWTGNNNKSLVNKSIASTINTNEGNRRCDASNYIVKGLPENIDLKCNGNDLGVVVLGNYSPSNHNASRVVDSDGIAPTVMENHGTVTATLVKEKSLFTETQAKMINENGDVKRYINSNIVDKFNEGQCADISFPNGYNKACRVHDECRPAINATTTQSSFIVKNDLRIRKLTPKECFRLMGFSDEDFDKASKFNSKTQLYKQAGNSIVVNVLMKIFKKLL